MNFPRTIISPLSPATAPMDGAPASITDAAPDAGHDVSRKAMRGIGWSSVQYIANNAVSFATYALLARLLRPGDFGLLAFATVFTVFLQMFVEQGIPDAIVQRVNVRGGHLNAAFWFNLSVSTGLMVILWFASPVAASLMNDLRLTDVLRWLAPLLVLSALCGVQQAVLKRRLNYKSLAIQSLISTVVGGAVAVFCAFHGYGVWSLVAQQLASSIVTVVMLWTVSPWRPGFGFAMQDFRELTRFSVHVTTSAFLDFINRRSDDFLVGYFLGPIALGYYSLAYRLLLTFTRLISAPFNSVAFSAFSRLQHEPGEMRRLFNHLTHLSGRLAFPAFLGLAAIAPDFVQVLFGAKWQAATPVLRILCFIGVLHSIAFLHGTAMRAAGRANWQMWFTFGGALTNVLGFCYFVRFGLIYVAGWYVASAYLWLAVDLALLQRVLEHRTGSYLSSFAGPALKGVAVCATVFLVRFICPETVSVALRFIFELLAGTAVFAATNAEFLRNPLGALRAAPNQP